MDLGESLAVYIDDRVEDERWVSNEEKSSDETNTLPILDSAADLQRNIELLISTFKKVHLCNSGKSFASKLAELSEEAGTSSVPVFGFIDIDYTSESLRRRSVFQASSQPALGAPQEDVSLRRSLTFSSQSEELSGLHLLSRFSDDIQIPDEPNIIVPIAVLRNAQTCSDQDCPESLVSSDNTTVQNQPITARTPLEKRRIHRCLDAGAVDVLTSPLDESMFLRLNIHAYRTQRTAQKAQARFLTNRNLRKRSWVGASDQQPYAYLREAMVSKLMKRICRPEEVIEDFPACQLHIPEERKREIEAEVAEWRFCAHNFTDDELVYASSSMIEHALQLPELEPWRISTADLQTFILSSRAAYNSFVLYHNFRHAVDVLQSTFHFLVRIGTLPEYPGKDTTRNPPSDIASILTPFDALALLITAIGHDVGHPGVNNFFLVKLNAPLAQLYNDKSVLEAFHCAAFSQILRRHWPAAFKDSQLRALLISSILATDMGVHNQFIESMSKIREDYHAHRGGGEKWKPQDPEGCRTLLCALLIKCADIGNVARKWNVAERWADILQQEFAHQGEMEREIGMETALFGGPPDLEDLVKRANGQIAFMQIFALPLFDGVTELLPDMAFAANEIRHNMTSWNRVISREKAKELPIESRPTEEHMSQRERDEGYYTKQSSNPPPESWKEPPALPQYDGSDEEIGAEGPLSSREKQQDPQGCTPSYPQSTAATSPNTGTDNHNNKGGSHGYSPVVGAPSLPSSNGHHPSEYRRSMGYSQFQRLSGRSSVTTAVNNRQNESSTSGRTQSTSTYTNNTVMTPISSTTQASSVISADSSYDGENYMTEKNGYPTIPNAYPDPAPNDNDNSRQERAGVPYPYNPYHHHSGRHNVNGQSMERTTNFMTSLLDQSFGTNNGRGNGIALKDPTSAPSSDGHILSSSAPTSPPTSHASNTSASASGRTILSRRSRLRLAFWRRGKQPSSSPPPQTPYHEY